MDNDVVSVDALKVLALARSSRNDALDRLEIAGATIEQLKKEREELRKQLSELASETQQGGDNVALG